MHGHQPTSQFVGIARSYPNSVHDLLCYEDPLSDSSSTWDNYLEEASAPRRVCAMAAAPSEPPPKVAPLQEMHTPRITVCRRSPTRRPMLRNFVPSTSTRPRWRISPHDLTPGRKRQIPLVLCGSAREINRDIINEARMQLPQEFHASQNIAAVAILLLTLSEPQDPA